MKAVKGHSQTDIHCHLMILEKKRSKAAGVSLRRSPGASYGSESKDGDGTVRPRWIAARFFFPFWSYKNVLFVAVEVLYYGNLA